MEWPGYWYHNGMIIRFHNLGKIKETELDLRPMTVIIGPNNSNKTYIAYSVYGLWKAQRRRFRASLNFKVSRKPSEASEGRKASSNRPVFFVDVSPAFLGQVLKRIRDVSERFRSELDTYFQDSSGKLFTNTSYELQISGEEVVGKLSRTSDYRMSIRHNEVRYAYIVSYSENQILVRWTNPEVDGAYAGDESSLDGHEKEAQELASLSITSFLLNALFPDSFLLPAERNALIITYKMLETRRYKLMRDVHRQRRLRTGDDTQSIDLMQEEEPVRYPQPVEDFLDFLTDVENAPTRIIPRPKSAKSFAELADVIEESIQDGNKTGYRSTVLGGKEIVIDVGGDVSIDLYNASSSIKQLAPLLLYLRYRARENDLLIIDEPEMNLHPESQVKLLEVLALLVNHGVNVLVTTHSPYIMAHLNNLAQDGATSQAVKNRQAKSLYLKNPNSLLTMDQVSAYEMRDNQLHSLKEEGYGIRWNTLSDVSVDLQQKYFEIYEEGHAKEQTKATRRAAQNAGGQDRQD